MVDSEAFCPASVASNVTGAHYAVADRETFRIRTDLEHHTREFPAQNDATTRFRTTHASDQSLAGIEPYRADVYQQISIPQLGVGYVPLLDRIGTQRMCLFVSKRSHSTNGS